MQPRAPKFLEVLKVYDRSLPAKWKGKIQVCECGIKKEEDREIYWAQIGHKKKCRTDVFRIQKIYYKSNEGEWSPGSLNDFEASSVDIKFSKRGAGKKKEL